MNNPVVDNLIALELLTDGVAPLGYLRPGATSIPCYFDINRVLAELPPDEARAMRRRFRKLWRSIARKAAEKGGRKNRIKASQAGLGAASPTRCQKLTRKMYVLSDARKNAKERLEP